MQVHGTAPPGRCWADCFVFARYVDDILLMSPFVCEECLAAQLQAWSPVSFDKASAGPVAEWLDMLVSVDADGALQIQLGNAVLRWRLLGIARI